MSGSSPPPGSNGTTTTVTLGKGELQSLLSFVERASSFVTSGGRSPTGAEDKGRESPNPHPSIAGRRSPGAASPTPLQQGNVVPSLSPSLTVEGLKEMDKELVDVLAKCRRIQTGDVELEKTRHETEKSYAKLASVKAELVSLEDELKKTTEKTRTTEMELKRKQKDLEMKIESERLRQELEIRDLQRRLEEAQRAGSSESAESRKLREQLAREKAENERLNATKREIMSELESIRLKLQEQANLKAQLEQRRSEKLRERERLQKNHEEKMKKLHRMLDEMLYQEGRLRSEQVDLKYQNEELGRAASGAESEARYREKQARAKAEHVSALETEIAKASKQKDHQRSMYDMEKDHLDSAKKGVRQAAASKKKARAELYTQLNEKEFQQQLLGMAQSEVKDLEEQMETEIRRTESLKKETASLQAEHEELSTLVDEQEQLKEQMLDTIAQQKQEAIDTLKKRLEQVRKRSAQIVADAKKDSGDARAKLDEVIGNYTKLQIDTDQNLAEAQRVKRNTENVYKELGDIRAGSIALTQELERAGRLVEHEKTKRDAKATQAKTQTVKAMRAGRELENTKKHKESVEETRSAALVELESAKDRAAAQEAAKGRLVQETSAMQSSLDDKLADVESTAEAAHLDIAEAEANAQRDLRIQGALAEKAQHSFDVAAAAKAEDVTKLTVAEREARAAALEVESQARAQEDEARKLSRRVLEESKRAEAAAADAASAAEQADQVSAQAEAREREARYMSERNRVVAGRVSSKREKAAEEEAAASAAADSLAVDRTLLEKKVAATQLEIDAERRKERQAAASAEQERQRRLAEAADAAVEETEEARGDAEKDHRERVDREARHTRTKREAERRLQREKEERLEALTREREEEERQRAALASTISSSKPRSPRVISS
eukprot:m51a1_g1775 hypothetical protein (903) ;mRNA; f:324063-327198